jgi:hypothetical protein
MPSNDTMLLLPRSRVLRDTGQTTPLNDSSLFLLRSSDTNEGGNTTPDNDFMAFPRRIRVVTADMLSKMGADTEVMFKLYRTIISQLVSEQGTVGQVSVRARGETS